MDGASKHPSRRSDDELSGSDHPRAVLMDEVATFTSPSRDWPARREALSESRAVILPRNVVELSRTTGSCHYDGR
jgi:hypothetical protein